MDRTPEFAGTNEFMTDGGYKYVRDTLVELALWVRRRRQDRLRESAGEA